MAVSRSAKALARLLDKGGPGAQQIRTRLHRTVLWKLTTGRRLPELSTALLLHRESRGRVSVFGWIPPTPSPKAEA